MNEVSPETAQPMYVPHPGPEDRLTFSGGGMMGGSEWVRADVFEQVQGIAFDLRRTLAMIHMYLAFGHHGDAYARVMRDTGLTVDDARALRSIVMDVLAADRSIPPGQPTPPAAEADTSAGGL